MRYFNDKETMIRFHPGDLPQTELNNVIDFIREGIRSESIRLANWLEGIFVAEQDKRDRSDDGLEYYPEPLSLKQEDLFYQWTFEEVSEAVICLSCITSHPTSEISGFFKKLLVYSIWSQQMMIKRAQEKITEEE